MNTIKELYSSPTTKILVVKIGGMLCTSDPNGVRSNSASSGYESENDLGEI